jgi:hypothetical protein
MDVRLAKEVGRPSAYRWVLLILAGTAYLGLPSLATPIRPWDGHFPRLAQAFLHGRLDILPDPSSHQRSDELIPSRDGTRLYCPYPPLPAVLLMPFVMLFGLSATVETATRIVSVLNLLLFDACLLKLPEVLGLPRLQWRGRVLLDVLFGLGTAALHNAMTGGDWHLAHAVALCAMQLALLEYSRARRPSVLGVCIAAVVLTRPTAVLACAFFAMPLLRSRRPRELVLLVVPPILAASLLAAYNFARFGDPLDFGYQRMLLTGDGKICMETFGQFHPHFILGNLFWFFLAPPWPLVDGRFPWLGFDLRGLSLFLACPPTLYAFVAMKDRWGQAAVRDAAAAVLLSLIPLLLYFNTGYAQFGHRFSMDYLAPLLVLVVAGIGTRPSRLAFALTAVALLVQFWGLVLMPITRIPIG